ncbi:hypothetical protein MUK42_02456 [Musa troglodytarum]|uniref:DEAD-box helicase OB fold domain-containing protein n=1 Tax=Musa troglodytarum TaxID=320322 RepID=A0A9E7JF36_9LILI|nr:hypothetical protein MUK42_02456 [Musa troglodytarum]
MLCFNISLVANSFQDMRIHREEIVSQRSNNGRQNVAIALLKDHTSIGQVKNFAGHEKGHSQISVERKKVVDVRDQLSRLLRRLGLALKSYARLCDMPYSLEFFSLVRFWKMAPAQTKILSQGLKHAEILRMFISMIEIDNPSLWILRKAIIAGFFANSCHLEEYSHNGLYKTVRSSEEVYIHPSSVLFRVNPKWVVYHSLVSTNKHYMRNLLFMYPQTVPLVCLTSSGNQ